MFLRQSTSQTIRFGPALDKTDGVTEETALTLAQADMRISKDGGAFAQKNATGNATHDSDGWYSTLLNATDTATVGELILNIHQPANMLPVWMRFYVVEEAVYDQLFAAAAAGAATVAALATVDTVVDGIQTDLSNGTDGLGAIKAQADAVKTQTNDIEGDTAGIAGAAMRGTDGANTVIPPTAAAITDAVWDEDVETSHQTAGSAGKKLDDAGGAADPWTTALPGGYGIGTAGKIIGDNIDAPISIVDTAVDGVQNDLDNGTDGLGAIKAAVDAVPTSNPTAAAIADQVWDELMAGHVTADTAGLVLNELQNGGRLDLLIDAIKAVTDLLPNGGALSSLATAANLATVAADVGGLAGEAMRGTNSAALATVCTEGRLAELDAANVPADLDAVLADTGELQVDWANGGRLDLILDAILAMLDDPRAEPGQGAPPSSADAMTKLDYMYKDYRNKKDNDGSTTQLYNDAGTVVDQKQSTSEAAGTVTKGEWIAGP